MSDKRSARTARPELPHCEKSGIQELRRLQTTLDPVQNIKSHKGKNTGINEPLLKECKTKNYEDSGQRSVPLEPKERQNLKLSLKSKIYVPV